MRNTTVIRYSLSLEGLSDDDIRNLIGSHIDLKSLQETDFCFLEDPTFNATYVLKNRLNGIVGFPLISKETAEELVEKLISDRKSTKEKCQVKNKYDIPMMKSAFAFSELSSCNRLKVGAVASKNGRPLITGYNGTISGIDNCCEDDCEVCGGSGEKPNYKSGEGRESCTRCGGKGLTSKKTVVHAEQNAIYYAAKHGISLDGASMHITHAPCVECSKAMASAGIVRVVYVDDYRDMDGVDFLKEVGVEVFKLQTSE